MLSRLARTAAVRRGARPLSTATAGAGPKKKGLLHRLQDGEVIGDGGYLFCLEHRGYMQAGPWTPECVTTDPEAVKQLHREFKRAGSDVLQTLTFYGTEDKMERQGHGDKATNSNIVACELAAEIAGEEALVAGTISQCPAYEKFQAGEATLEDVAEQFRKQLALQVGTGHIDFIIVEYFEHLEEMVVALNVAKEFGKDVMTTMAMGPDGSKDGHSAADVARVLADEGSTVIGTNCFFDPDVTLETLSRMKEGIPANKLNITTFLGAQPVAFLTPDPCQCFLKLPEYPLAMERRLLSRYETSRFATRGKELGLRYFGGCCGFEPYHIRSMAEALGRTTPASDKSAMLSGAISPFLRARAEHKYWEDLIDGKGGAPTKTAVFPRAKA